MTTLRAARTPPPACNLAVSDHEDNQRLVRDCQTLLDIRDALRGTAALNWSFTKDIRYWDGMKMRGGRVTNISLANKSLTGTIPAALTKLELTTLKLAGNSLTGCIPSPLREVANNDLDELGLPDCAG